MQKRKRGPFSIIEGEVVGMIISMIMIMIALLLTIFSISLRLIATGTRITHKAVSGTNYKENYALTATQVTLYRLAKLIGRLRNIVLGAGAISGLVIGVITLVVIAGAGVYITSLNEKYMVSLEDQYSKEKEQNSQLEGTGWEEIEVCETEDSTKTYMGYKMITATDTPQYKLFNDGLFGEAKRDDLGFMYIDGKDPATGTDERYYTVALGSYYTTEIGDKFRVTLETGNVIYVILGDQKADKDTRSGNASAKIKEGMSEAEIIEHDPDRCKDGAGAMIEFIVDEDYMLAGKYGGGQYINNGSMDYDFDSEHKFSGKVVKIEKLTGVRDTSVGKEITGDIYWIGDSRTVGMQYVIGETGKDHWYCEGSQGYDKMLEYIPQVTAKAQKGDYIVVNMGVNDALKDGYAQKTASKLNELVKGDWRNFHVIYMSVNPVIDERTYYVDTKDVLAWNEYMKSNLDDSIFYLDTYSVLINNAEVMNGIDAEGLHYDTEGTQFIYDYVRKYGAKTASATALGRYYETDEDGITGIPEGITNAEARYASGRNWDTNNHYGCYPLPDNWVWQIEHGSKDLVWEDGTEVGIKYIEDDKDPLNHSILVYKVGKVYRYAFIEQVNEDKSIIISETGYASTYYSSLRECLKDRNGVLVYMVKTTEDSRLSVKNAI